MFCLGCMYRDGLGVDEDFEKAFIWLSIATEQGSYDAQCNLGVMYIDGNGVPESLDEGAYLITSAYENGYEPAGEFLDEYDLWGM